MKLPPEDDAGAPILSDPSGSEEQTTVPATAPPRDPRVLYTVPTFKWKPSSSGPADVTRYGNGLRVWLDRPWFSSGDGELLGVVIFADGGRFTDIPAAFQPLVTQWGMDPFWDSALPKTQTKATDFPASVISESLRLQEKSGATDPFVHIVGHRVHWDDDRHLWYCDIELDPGATYMPFVRLALVRYQPNALAEAKISKVVLADFAQVLPRRRATLKVQSGRVQAELRGPNPSFGPMKFSNDSAYQNISFMLAEQEKGRNRVELVLQTLDPAIDSDLGWEDSTILAAHIVGEEPPAPPNGVIVGPAIEATTTLPNLAANVKARVKTAAATVKAAVKTVETRASGAVKLGPAVDLGKITDVLDFPPFQFDSAFWETDVALGTAGSRPRRLMLREFERFYTDQAIAVRRGSATDYRRVIEERLVFVHILPLD